MKTPEEINKGLEIARNGCMTCDCCITDCPYDLECYPTNEDTNVDMPKQMAVDALAYIQQLENHIGGLTEKVAQLDQVTRERDALLEIVKKLGACNYCKHDSYCTHIIPDCMDCKDENCQCYSCSHRSKWQWRGEQEGER